MNFFAVLATGPVLVSMLGTLAVSLHGCERKVVVCLGSWTGGVAAIEDTANAADDVESLHGGAVCATCGCCNSSAS